MKITIKSNGYNAEGIQTMIEKFNIAAEKTFPDCEVRHFYYGDKISMTDIILPDRHYGHFTITANSVHFSGHTCTAEQYAKFGALTHNDDLFKGQLMKLAEC